MYKNSYPIANYVLNIIIITSQEILMEQAVPQGCPLTPFLYNFFYFDIIFCQYSLL